jgi:hypothetical protein
MGEKAVDTYLQILPGHSSATTIVVVAAAILLYSLYSKQR